MNDCESAIIPALKEAVTEGTSVSSIDGDCRVVVPMERSDRDAIALRISDQGESYRITDDGETYGYLYLSNINIETDSRSNRLDSIKERFNLETVRKTISLQSDPSELGQRLLDAVQAVQAVSYLSYTRKQYTQADFETDVGSFLELKGYKFNRYARVGGLSEDVRVDFSITNQPQPTYLEALHAEDESTSTSAARRAAYKWGEIQEKDQNAMTISVVDDEAGEVSNNATQILKNWSDVFVPWSERERLDEVLG